MDGQVRAITGRFRVGHSGYSPADIGGEITFHRARILDLPSRRLRLTGDVAVSGTWPHLRLASPVLAVEDGHIALPESFFTGATELQLDPRIEVRRRGIDRTVVEEVAPFPMPELDLHVELNRAMDIDASMPTEQVLGEVGAGLSTLRVQADLDGIFDIQTTNGVLQVSGGVEPLRGTATVLGRPFEIVSGEVTLTGRDYASPYLDVTAVYATSGRGNITVNITGTATSPELTVTGDEYPSQDDVVAILLFGAPLSELDLTAGGQALMAAVMASLKGGVIGGDSLRGLDVLEVGVGGTSRVGKRVGRNVLVVITWNPAADVAGSPPENVVQVDVEIQVPRVKWILVATTGTSGRSTLSAVRKWKF